MHRLCQLLALLCLTIVLPGCHTGEQRYLTRVSNGGSDSLYSMITIDAHKVRFDCRVSDSGQCHYNLFAHDCATSASCGDRPFLQLMVRAGEVQIIDTPTSPWYPCVSQHDDVEASSCLRAKPSSSASDAKKRELALR